MEPIKKNGLDRKIKHHEMNVERIQSIVNDMIETGFVFGSRGIEGLGFIMCNLACRAIEMAAKRFIKNKNQFQA